MDLESPSNSAASALRPLNPENEEHLKKEHTVTSLNEVIKLPVDTKKLQMFLQEFPRQRAVGRHSRVSKNRHRRATDILPQNKETLGHPKRSSFDSISHQGDFTGLGGGQWSLRPAFTFQNLLPYLLNQMHRQSRSY